RAAVRRVVFETTIFRWIVRRRNHNAVRKVLLAAAIVDKDGMRDDRRGRHAIVSLDYGLDVVGRENFQRGTLRRLRYCVRVLAQEKRTVSSLAAPIFTNRLRDGLDVSFIESATESRTAVPAGSEADLLAGIVQVRPTIIVFAFKPGHIDQYLFRRRP